MHFHFLINKNRPSQINISANLGKQRKTLEIHFFLFVIKWQFNNLKK